MWSGFFPDPAQPFCPMSSFLDRAVDTGVSRRLSPAAGIGRLLLSSVIRECGIHLGIPWSTAKLWNRSHPSETNMCELYWTPGDPSVTNMACGTCPLGTRSYTLVCMEHVRRSDTDVRGPISEIPQDSFSTGTR